MEEYTLVGSRGARQDDRDVAKFLAVIRLLIYYELSGEA